ncbi:MAG: contractile injection system protein, VgrG/Pvc8 family, partial [Polyangiaceae bacterium]
MGASTAEIRLEGGPIPADAVVDAYRAFEGLSRPFEVEVEFHTMDTSFEVDACLKQALLLRVVGENMATRFFHGIVDRAEITKVRNDRFFFRVHLVPG